MIPSAFDPAHHRLPPISDEARRRIADLIEIRQRWNRTHDLVGPAAAADPWRVDVCDALAVRVVMDAERPLVDVGAGGGVPGLFLACLRPEHPVWLVEPRTKRVAFLRSAKHALGLESVRVTRGRWPDDAPLDRPSQLVSRAVVAPAAWPELAALGGANVTDIIRMLTGRPQAFPLSGFHLAREHVYRDDEARRIDRWTRG